LFGRGRRIYPCVVWVAQADGHLLVMKAGVFAGSRGYLRRQQVHNNAIFIGCPHAAVPAQEGSPSAFLASKSQATPQKTFYKPFEADRHFHHLPAYLAPHPVYHAAADQSLANGAPAGPLMPVLKEIPDSYRK